MKGKLIRIIKWFCNSYNLLYIMLVLVLGFSLIAATKQFKQNLTNYQDTITENAVKVTECDYRLVVIEDGGIIYIDNDYGLTPYYSPNGKLCCFVDGEIVEIEEGN